MFRRSSSVQRHLYRCIALAHPIGSHKAAAYNRRCFTRCANDPIEIQSILSHSAPDQQTSHLPLPPSLPFPKVNHHFTPHPILKSKLEISIRNASPHNNSSPSQSSLRPSHTSALILKPNPLIYPSQTSALPTRRFSRCPLPLCPQYGLQR